MRRKTKQIGLMIGVMMMTAMIGTGTVFAAGKPAKTEKTEKTVTASKSGSSEKSGDLKDKNKKKNDQKAKAEPQGKKEKQENKEKQNSVYYGKVKKIENDKVILEEAEIVSEEDSSTAKGETAADFENGTVKWKLTGRTIEIKLDSDTKLYKEMISPKDGKNSQDKKQDSAKNDDKKSKDKKQDSAKDDDTKNKGIPLKKIREGILAKVTLKEDGSGIASEIMMLSGVKEVKSA